MWYKTLQVAILFCTILVASFNAYAGEAWCKKLNSNKDGESSFQIKCAKGAYNYFGYNYFFVCGPDESIGVYQRPTKTADYKLIGVHRDVYTVSALTYDKHMNHEYYANMPKVCNEIVWMINESKNWKYGDVRPEYKTMLDECVAEGFISK